MVWPEIRFLQCYIILLMRATYHSVRIAKFIIWNLHIAFFYQELSSVAEVYQNAIEN